MEYKNQHTVTAAYLKEWCDPNTPTDQTPYVWMVTKDGRTVDNKAPKNLFSENNFYTVYDNNGERNLKLEYYLHKVEDNFLAARKRIMAHRPLTN